jgi:hypothetical protein
MKYRSFLHKEVNGYLGAALILTAGFGFMAYVALGIDWKKMEATYTSIAIPLFFTFLILVTAFKAASNKDINITSAQTDEKIGNSIQSFKVKHQKSIKYSILSFYTFAILYLIAMLVSAYVKANP